MQIDLTPRSDTVLMNALRTRLGQHFQFQSAQRLALGREEERCIQSGGTDVFFHMDKMDQQKCILPCVWPLLSTPLFKGGERLVVGIVGGLFRGAVNTEMIVRSVFQDHSHGSNMQASAALLNIHSSAMKEGRLPNKYCMGADNTYKETKNQFYIGFVVWLLCVLLDTNLWCFELFFLLVGHTHGALDRFFSHLAAVLIGKTYLTLDQMQKIFITELRRFNIRCEHQHTVWDFKALKDHFKWPAISGLSHVHGIKIYRRSGVWIQWRQYLTDASWSKPILLVPPHLVRSVAAYRPSPVPLKFPFAHKMHLWANKFETVLADPNNTIDKYKEFGPWFRSIIDHQNPVQTGPSIDRIISDLLDLGRTGFSKSEVGRSDLEALPADSIVQLFPGADLPSVPVDALVHIEGVGGTSRPKVLIDASLVICKSTPLTKMNGTPLLFTLAQIVDCRHGRDDLLVAWWVPPLASKADFKGGRKKKIVDVFGPWKPLAQCTLDELDDTDMPCCLVSHDAVLEMNVELENGKIPFSAFDALRNKHGIDVTGLSTSLTQGGNLYRSHCLMGIRADKEYDFGRSGA